MKRGWFVVLALSLGLNAGLLFVHFSRLADNQVAPPPEPAGEEMGGPPGPMSHPGNAENFIRDRVARAGKRLNLSDEQIKSMSEILDGVTPEMMERRQHIWDLRLQMRDEYLRPDVDADRIQELREEASLAQSQLDSIMVETMMKEARILTPEQREAYFQLMPFGEQGRHGGARMRRGRHWQGN
jgi:Spy/CpxP family protein refolding chaperone